ncbi:MAG TPA: hypothetical protein VF486_16940, partial [Actinomycetes bacterium]
PATANPGRRRLPTRPRLLGYLTGVALAGGVVALALGLPHPQGRQPAAANVPASWARPVVSKAGLAERSGVKLTRVAVTGAGGLVDLRYQVLDPDKADSLHDKATPPALVDERTGLVVHTLFMGHSHHGSYKVGVTYYLVFENPGNWVHRGSEVTVLLGNAQVEHVKVA